MTDNEIIKALEYCPKATTLGDCEKLECPALRKEGCYYACFGEDIYENELMKDALSVINRQKAKIEALQMDNEQLQSDIVNANMNAEHALAEIERLQFECGRLERHTKMHDEIITDAIKEFAERLKEKLVEESYDDCQFFKVVGESEIDSLVKEMVGEDK